MNNFLTWDFLLSFAGCVTATGVVTEIVKRLCEKLSSKMYQIISYFIALLILIIAQIATRQFSGWDLLALDLFNAAVVSLASNGSYDFVHHTIKLATDAETELIDEGDEA